MAYADALRQAVFNPGTCASLIEGIFGDNNLIAFTAYTPTLSGVGITVSSSTLVEAKYAPVDNFVILFVKFYQITWSGGGASGEGYSITLPIDSIGSGTFVVGNSQIAGDGTTTGKVGYLYPNGTTTINSQYYDRGAFAASASNGVFNCSAIYRRR